MKKTIALLLAAIISLVSVAQNFEGKINYSNAYKSKMPGVTDAQFTAMMGPTQEYFIKAGDYKSISNGSLVQWQLYVNNDNKLYTKTANTELLLWNDGADNADEVIKAEINNDVTEILGYKCDELVLTCKSGIEKYYFSSELGISAELFANHKFGNWFEVVSRTKSLPLKMIIDHPQFWIESIATTVTPVKLESTFFALPENAQTMKSPY
ncbi:MAG: hypothetical protein IPP72_19240 [Chitinophagaceae bacterium]|nr:hypothetical protein [Chitinophagaceae bacterium]